MIFLFLLVLGLSSSFGAERTLFDCDPDKPKITVACPSPKVVKITFANFGRRDSNTCPEQSSEETNSNESNNNTRVCITQAHKYKKSSRNKCFMKSSCTIERNKAYHEPCLGVSKYLEVWFTCVTSFKGLKNQQAHKKEKHKKLVHSKENDDKLEHLNRNEANDTKPMRTNSLDNETSSEHSKLDETSSEHSKLDATSSEHSQVTVDEGNLVDSTENKSENSTGTNRPTRSSEPHYRKRPSFRSSEHHRKQVELMDEDNLGNSRRSLDESEPDSPSHSHSHSRFHSHSDDDSNSPSTLDSQRDSHRDSHRETQRHPRSHSHSHKHHSRSTSSDVANADDTDYSAVEPDNTSHSHSRSTALSRPHSHHKRSHSHHKRSHNSHSPHHHRHHTGRHHILPKTRGNDPCASVRNVRNAWVKAAVFFLMWTLVTILCSILWIIKKIYSPV